MNIKIPSPTSIIIFYGLKNHNEHVNTIKKLCEVKNHNIFEIELEFEKKNSFSLYNIRNMNKAPIFIYIFSEIFSSINFVSKNEKRSLKEDFESLKNNSAFGVNVLQILDILMRHKFSSLKSIFFCQLKGKAKYFNLIFFN